MTKWKATVTLRNGDRYTAIYNTKEAVDTFIKFAQPHLDSTLIFPCNGKRTLVVATRDVHFAIVDEYEDPPPPQPLKPWIKAGSRVRFSSRPKGPVYKVVRRYDTDMVHIESVTGKIGFHAIYVERLTAIDDD